ncbi:GlmU family protein [Ignavibacteria bacterium]|nr:hypothetical protein [Bacteroidota bacterium]MCZ2133753.1 hypothetical protein [Bacteroidota bacterium]
MNNISILLAEPRNVGDLYPFSILHCLWELRCGALRLFEKYGRYFPEASLHFAGRTGHVASFIARHYPQTGIAFPSAEILVILSGNILPDAEFVASLNVTESGDGFLLENKDEEIVGAILRGVSARSFTAELAAASGDVFFDDALQIAARYVSVRRKIPVRILRYMWDALENNGCAITADARIFGKTTPFRSDPASAVVGVNEASIFAADSAEIAPGVILDATDGPILISENVRIMANSVIIGPCAIGANSIIKIGAKIYGDTSFGEFCKIGGEIENSIVQAFSNKQHDGFLGHSYLGEWANLGADTNTSDLKNTYAPIVIRLEGRRVATDRIMLGLLCGDHTKSGINTMFTTGTVVGVSSSVVGADYAPSVIPSFSFGGQAEAPVYNIERALDVARVVMARRGKMLLVEEEVLLRKEYERVTAGD